MQTIEDSPDSELEENSKYKILTIDDEAYIRQSIINFLEDYNFNVIEAENGKVGLDLFERESPDLVVLDLRMPQMDGLQVLEILKDKSPDTPLVVASGTGNITAVVKALQLGAWDYILKPIEDMDVLYHSVQKCLKQSQLKKENKQYQEQLEDLVAARTLDLQKSQELYKTVFEYTGTAAVIIEPDDSISMVNSKFCEFAGMEGKDIIDRKKWYDFIALEHVDIMQRFIDTKMNPDQTKTQPPQSEIRFIGHQHQEKYVYSSVGVIPGSDQVILSLLDVTEKKKAEQRWKGLERQLRKSQKMEAIGTLAGGIAHDLNNILSPILGYADMIMRSSDPAANVYKRSRKIQQAAMRAADLVSQVLSVNRRGPDEKRRIKVHPVSKEVLKLLKGSIPATIRIVDQIDRNCSAIEADPTQIHQVMMNLCTNAYHAMEADGGTLTVGLREITITTEQIEDFPNLEDGPGRYIVLEVSDTGCGMEEDIIERIFDPYFTTKEEGKGTGLGLSTVYSIIKACRGEIKVKSRLNQGTQFQIYLPAVEAREPKDNRFKAESAEKASSGDRILVVDDDENIALMCKDGFISMGYEVDVFSSSTEALAFFKEHHPAIDVVLTDQTMPNLTGLELARAMHAINDKIPILLFSGYATNLSKPKVEAAGIKKFLMKPITIEALSIEIQACLDKNEVPNQ